MTVRKLDGRRGSLPRPTDLEKLDIRLEAFRSTRELQPDEPESHLTCVEERNLLAMARAVVSLLEVADEHS